MSEKDYKPIKEDVFKQVVRDVLLKPPKVKSVNKRPSKEELKIKYKIIPR